MALAKTVTPAELARVLGITPRWVQTLAAQGVLQREGRGRYALDQSVQAFVNHRVESEVDRRATTPAADAVKTEQARKLRLQNDRTESLSIDTETALAAIDRIVGLVRVDLAGVPARIATDLTQRRALEDGIDKVLAGLADRLAEAGAALSTGGDPLATDDEVDG